MERDKRPIGTTEDLDDFLFYLSRKVLDETTLLEQAVIYTQIRNIKSIKESINKSDCFYCWKCIKSLIKKLNPWVWIPLIFKSGGSG